MICPRCGKENPDGSRFCNGCGAPLGQDDEDDAAHLHSNGADTQATAPLPGRDAGQAESAVPVTPSEGAAKRVSPRNAMIIAAVAVVVIVIVALAAGGTSSSANNASRTTNTSAATTNTHSTATNAAAYATQNPRLVVDYDEDAPETNDFASANLTHTATFKGVSFYVDPSWQSKIYDEASATFSFRNKGGDAWFILGVDTYTNGETSNLESMQNTGAIISARNVYSSSTETVNGIDFWQLTWENGDTVQHDLVGYDPTTGHGFKLGILFGDDNRTKANCDTLSEIFQSTTYDPSGTTSDWVEENKDAVAKRRTSSTSSGAGKSTSGGSSQSSTSNSNSSSASQPKTYPTGTYIVGDTLPAGEYKLTASGHAYFCVYPDATKGDILENDNFTTCQYITVTDGQVVELDGCSAVAAADVAANPQATVAGDGRYKVGTDIKAGTYSLNVDSSGHGYYCVYNSSAVGASIVQNNNFTNNDVIAVSEGQYLEVDGCTGATS